MNTDSIKEIFYTMASNLLNNDAILVDVREKDETKALAFDVSQKVKVTMQHTSKTV